VSTIADARNALAYFAKVPSTAHDLRAEPGDTFGRPPLTTLVQNAHALGSRAELDELLAAVAPAIVGADPFRGATIALTCGTLVEWGGNPDNVFPHLLAELPRQLSLARRAAERGEIAPSALFDSDPDAARAAKGLTYFLLATMTVICRKAAFRQALRANPEIVSNIEVLRESHREADFVGRVLDLTDDLELVVIAPTEKKGFRVALEAIASSAHMFTLLQAALIDGGHLAGEPTDPEVVAVARGEQPHEQLLTDHARLHFYDWDVLRPDGTFDPFPIAGAFIPVESTPAGIRELDGTRVVVIGPPMFASRAWDSNFFAGIHDALRSRADIIEVLPEAAVEKWIERIKTAPR
jgi:hypothetical protein